MKFILTHKKITGSIVIEYDAQGRIHSFEFDCEAGQDLWQFMMDNFPLQVEVLRNTAYKNFKINEVPGDITFDGFWKAYDHKVGNKARAKRLFELLNPVERTVAICTIKHYNAFLLSHPNQDKCYPETYLSQRRFENNF